MVQFSLEGLMVSRDRGITSSWIRYIVLHSMRRQNLFLLLSGWVNWCLHIDRVLLR